MYEEGVWQNLDDSVLEMVEQLESLPDRFFLVTSALPGIAGYEIFVEVAAVGGSHQVLQACLVRRETVAEARAVDVDHRETVAIGPLLAKEVRQVQVAMQNAPTAEHGEIARIISLY